MTTWSRSAMLAAPAVAPQETGTQTTAAPAKNPSSATIKTAKFFDHGFGKFLEDSNYYDVVLHHTASNVEYKAHRIILAAKSTFFDLLFSSRFMESKREKVCINFEDPDCVFPKVIEYLYKGEITVASQHVVALRVAADQFMCPDLSESLLTFLDGHLHQNNALSILFKALQVKDDMVLDKAVAFVAKEFVNLSSEFKERLTDFPPHVFFNIIANENLAKCVGDFKERNQLVSDLTKEFMHRKNVSADIELFKSALDALIASNTLSADDACMYLCECEKLGLAEQSAGCARVIAATLHNMASNDFLFKLKPHSFTYIINSDDLFVKTEDQVHILATEYIAKNPSLNDQEKRNIMQSVRYSFLSLSKLKEIRNGSSPFLTKKDLAEVLVNRIGRLEGAEFAKNLNLPQYKPRKMRVFNYISDFDTNGIMYWLGTNCGAENTFKNPLDNGQVDVQTSANFEAGNKQNLIGRDPTSCNLVNQANNSVTIEFKKIAVLPTKYTLRHTNARDNECLRNWKFMASKDGKTFEDLKDHVNDCSLNAKGATASWDLDGEKTNEYYSFFRIFQTGNNSSNNGYLSMSGFEVYGYVRSPDGNIMEQKE